MVNISDVNKPIATFLITFFLGWFVTYNSSKVSKLDNKRL